jgi:hypothetical protein
MFNLWQKDDKVYIELEPDQFDRPFFFKSAINQGIGEGRIFGGAMTYPVGVSQIVVFHKHGQTVQLIAKNVKYTATAGTPEARAVAAGFSDSLLSVAPISSQPHPEKKSVLIEANALLLADIPGAASMLERVYRQPYAFDARNSAIGTTRGQPDNVTLEVSAHYALSRLVLPPPPPAVSTLPSPPITLLDVRSLFIGYHYTFAKPDADACAGCRRACRLFHDRDPRFHVRRSARARAALCEPLAPEKWMAGGAVEPKQPIVFWLTASGPLPRTDHEGILEWNKAWSASVTRTRFASDPADKWTRHVQIGRIGALHGRKDVVWRDRTVRRRPSHWRDPRRRYRQHAPTSASCATCDRIPAGAKGRIRRIRTGAGRRDARGNAQVSVRRRGHRAAALGRCFEARDPGRDSPDVDRFVDTS